MKSFVELLSEKKDHIIKKMPLLSSDEKGIIIDFFKKKPNLENRIDWNKWRKLKFDDFQDVMGDTKSSLRRKAQKLRHKGVKGLKEGEDYIYIKTKNKSFLVYIPLNFKAAQVIASVNIGDCHGKWCIANSQARKYFKSQAKKQDLIPIMVIGNGQKYTVMMKESGSFDVWDAENKQAFRGEVIPNFSIKKELQTKRLYNLYSEIINDIWTQTPEKPEGIDPEDYKNAVDSYEEMAEDIESYVGKHAEARENYYNEVEEIRKDTIEQYKEWAIEAEEEAKNTNKGLGKIESRIKEIQNIMTHVPTGTGVNDTGEVVWNLRGIDYTADDLRSVFKVAKNEYALKYEEPNFTKRDELLYYADKIKDIEYYEMIEHDDIEWTDDLPYEDEINNEIQTPYIMDDSYDDYFDFAEDYFDFDMNEREDLQQAIYEIDTYSDGNIDGEEYLEDMGLPHPKEAKKRR